MKNRTLLKIALYCIVGLLYAARVSAQNLPDIIYVPVTFYDYHSDRSNPEFEQRHNSGLREGMVSTSLDAEGKPQLGASPYLNYYIKKWFRPWQGGDYTIPNYSPKAGYKQRYGGDSWVLEYRDSTIRYLGVQNVTYDTAFKNIVIRDSLPFVHLTGGMYEYKSDNFFPLDGKGFGNEWNHELGNTEYNAQQGINPNHNYSYTMELHWQFVKKPGMRFTFNGDDDVWVFVDKKLILDIGGIHEPIQKSFNVDDLGLVNGRQYDLHVFYAERHSAHSHILIQTNIISPPAEMGLYPEGSQPNVGSNTPYSSELPITAGNPFIVYAHLFDSAKVWQPHLSDNVTWTIVQNGVTTTSKGPFFDTTFTKTGDVQITATYSDPENPERISTKTLTVKVGPRPPVRLDIQEDSLVVSYNVKDGFNELYFAPNDDPYATIWAVLRDDYGNYVRHSTAAQWISADLNVATVNKLTGASARVEKRFNGEGEETIIIVTEPGMIPDTIAVGSVGRSQIAIGPNPFIPGVTLLSSTYSQKTIDNYRYATDGATKGMLITVSSPKPLIPDDAELPDALKTFGDVVIYDAVGNVVKRGKLKRSLFAARELAFLWNGYTDKGRKAGPGVYLVRVSGVYAEKTKSGQVIRKPFNQQKKAGISR